MGTGVAIVRQANANAPSVVNLMMTDFQEPNLHLKVGESGGVALIDCLLVLETIEESTLVFMGGGQT